MADDRVRVVLDREFQEFLKLKSKSTAFAYGCGFREFIRFYRGKHGVEAVASHLLDRIFDNWKRDRREQDPKLIEGEFVGFIDYMKARGRANKTMRTYVAAIQNFLKYYNITVSMSFVGNMPQPTTRPENSKHEWRIEEIRAFVDAANTYRDKAIIMCLFQSGIGVNELVSLSYGDIRDDYEKGTLPIQLKLTRQKTGVEFRTFLGRDAVKYLRLYLATRRNVKGDMPLFTRWGSDTERMTDGAIEMKFREIAKKLNFIDEDNSEGYNPCRPHSLRAAFNSRLTGKMDRVLIEFWMGHEIGEEKRAYLSMPTEEMRELYMDAEKYLSIERASRDEMLGVKEGGRIPPEAQAEIERLKATLDGLAKQYSSVSAENLELKSRMSWVELEVTELKKALEKMVG